MKKLFGIIALSIFFISISFGQVTIEKEISGNYGASKKAFGEAPKDEAIIVAYSNWIKTYNYTPYKGTKSGAIRVILAGLTEEMSQTISDQCFIQLVDAFKAEGITVKTLDSEKIMANKTYNKGVKAGGSLMNGTTMFVKGANTTKDDYMVSVPKGVNHVYLGTNPTLNYSVFHYELTEETDALNINYIPHFSFFEEDASGAAISGSGINVTVKPKLTIGSNSDVTHGVSQFEFNNGKNYGVYGVNLPVIANQNSEWVLSQTYDDKNYTFTITINPENFKKAILELNKACAKEYVAEFKKSLSVNK